MTTLFQILIFLVFALISALYIAGVILVLLKRDQKFHF